MENDKLEAVQKLEKEVGKTLVAFSGHDAKPADLSDEQLSKIKAEEKKNRTYAGCSINLIIDSLSDFPAKSSGLLPMFPFTTNPYQRRIADMSLIALRHDILVYYPKCQSFLTLAIFQTDFIPVTDLSVFQV
ncbi:hypothetical protein QUF72_17680 [Desulfobacterales bacterium HSG2]|nr:hypothetical protein [Desulfobacterales bacterium HSG2]